VAFFTIRCDGLLDGVLLFPHPLFIPQERFVAVRDAGEMFERDEAFSLRGFAEQSFGVFQEEPFDVVWKFSSEAAQNAREFQFHPTQKLEDQEDGSLIVRFHAGGELEMAWHLYTWGDNVEVLEPEKLADLVSDYRPHWDGLP
jgi:predicted DNA-binding transcriptional regulator YafY